ncbi:hypothetical protein A2763_00870 [Candidatus Kaiserbacteria bacterium RIFCSPHIGHO2_01_FULL_54_36]|uniref:Uncharacterized protein n=1 Tax=Candidatus Kaiserbacteria bacterium RIFCSPHIGHO2_01_FULL_54_36 TaxID=1798482 RepID=A0A1F6CPS4_9BACT|nr:MAG: hypothetical protein A2763_00870 [Candidatus Kaiserbacteria bacterium RIFCSPHIGHO2_01_FULL_54_36]OGG75577.1 MAG: hypothetical protein A3A41_03075 [Candidatus Kaiserbacteria bacterium RIFCSPLOWO2_01_FULL_54_22]
MKRPYHPPGGTAEMSAGRARFSQRELPAWRLRELPAGVGSAALFQRGTCTNVRLLEVWVPIGPSIARVGPTAGSFHGSFPLFETFRITQDCLHPSSSHRFVQIERPGEKARPVTIACY